MVNPSVPFPEASPGPPSENELRIVVAALRGDDSSQKRWRAILTEAELARAAKFALPMDRARFIARRGTLREVIGRFIDESPAKIAIATESAIKPRLANGALQFSVSSAGDLAAFALTLKAPVGADIAVAETLPNLTQISADWLHPEERAMLQGLSAQEASDLFHTFWTAKESYLKAIGTGLRDSLREINASAIANHFQPERVQDMSNHNCALNWYRIPMPAPIHLTAVTQPGFVVRLVDMR